jgi:hypothetical protein
MNPARAKAATARATNVRVLRIVVDPSGDVLGSRRLLVSPRLIGRRAVGPLPATPELISD